MRGAILLRVLQASLVLLIAYGVMLGCNFVRQQNVLPITTVQIEGSYHHVSRTELQSILSNFFPASFLTMDIPALKEQLLQNPWVYAVNITRQWPKTLKIKITEQNPVAKWGQSGLINDEGDIFSPSSATIPADFPVLYGPQNQAGQVLKEYRRFEQILAPKGFSIATLEMADSWAWKLKLTNGLVILLGNKYPVSRIQRFLDVYNVVFANNNAKALLVDLRYQHGMAVKWDKTIPSTKTLEKEKVSATNRGESILD